MILLSTYVMILDTKDILNYGPCQLLHFTKCPTNHSFENYKII